MPATTPPKGRPTTGKRDRALAQRRSQSRSTAKKFVWAVLALALVAAVIVLGSGSGGNANINTGGQSGFLLPLLVFKSSAWRRGPDPRS